MHARLKYVCILHAGEEPAGAGPLRLAHVISAADSKALEDTLCAEVGRHSVPAPAARGHPSPREGTAAHVSMLHVSPESISMVLALSSHVAIGMCQPALKVICKSLHEPAIVKLHTLCRETPRLSCRRWLRS